MKIVSVRANPGIFFHHGLNASLQEVEHRLKELTFNSAPINIGRELMRRDPDASFCEWRLWNFPTRTYELNGIPVKMFRSGDGIEMLELEQYLLAQSAPDVIWAEGIHLPAALRRIFELCPDSLKIVYPKYCEPWCIEGLEHYDACLVDEPWQIDEMARLHPGVRCRVWDKLVDYEHQFFPMDVHKEYDICYVARLAPRKYHKLLFTELAKITDRRLSVVLVGGNETDCQKYLEPMAEEAGVRATFTGHLEPEQVNAFINASRMGVLCDKYDAVPRAMLEYMAANVPVLATSEMRAGIRYIGQSAGLTRPPERFHQGIIEILERGDYFQPRAYLIDNFSRRQVVDRFEQIIDDLRVHKTTVSR